MYDALSGIEVFIKPYESEGQYKEYEAPHDSPLFTGNERERYIEAVTDERFEMVVLLHSEFSFLGETYAQILCDVDGGTRRPRKYIESHDIEADTPHRTTIDSVRETLDGKSRSIGFAFGEVHRGSFGSTTYLERCFTKLRQTRILSSLGTRKLAKP